jgi:hypothetical protein
MGFTGKTYSTHFLKLEGIEGQIRLQVGQSSQGIYEVVVLNRHVYVIIFPTSATIPHQRSLTVAHFVDRDIVASLSPRYCFGDSHA